MTKKTTKKKTTKKAKGSLSDACRWWAEEAGICTPPPDVLLTLRAANALVAGESNMYRLELSEIGEGMMVDHGYRRKTDPCHGWVAAKTLLELELQVEALWEQLEMTNQKASEIAEIAARHRIAEMDQKWKEEKRRQRREDNYHPNSYEGDTADWTMRADWPARGKM